ncbi:MAG: hypothetical protein J4F49_06045 [Rhodobacteraceae bacterium]|nr:hypothetical protein [Paracoccaceae bacterium]
MNATELNSRILDAWSRGDGQLLAELYSEAGNSLLDSGLENEGCFYLTQAYILALENGLDTAAALHADLVRHGREE